MDIGIHPFGKIVQAELTAPGQNTRILGRHPTAMINGDFEH
jgi:hypothetical protein